MSDATAPEVRYPFCGACGLVLVPPTDQCRAARVLRSYMDVCCCEAPVPRGEAPEPLDVAHRNTQEPPVL